MLVRPVPAGQLLRVRMAAGTYTGLLVEQAEAIAAFLEVREVRVTRDPHNARYAIVTVIRTDPLSGGPPRTWPNREARALSLWEPIPVGVGEDGQAVNITLPERNLLVGGEPGGGKSVAVSLLVATAALDPTVHITLFDGKLVELAVWRGCADRFVGPDLDEAVRVLGELREDMAQRYGYLLARCRRKLTREDAGSFPLRLVVVDELALYSTGERKAAAEFFALLRDLVARGRAAGVIVVAATQKPSSDIVPKSLRDLFGVRWSMRCSTPQASDTILGQGWASAGCSAATVDAADRGVGFLLHEGSWPMRLRSYYLADEDLAALAARGEALRATGPRNASQEALEEADRG